MVDKLLGKDGDVAAGRASRILQSYSWRITRRMDSQAILDLLYVSYLFYRMITTFSISDCRSDFHTVRYSEF